MIAPVVFVFALLTNQKKKRTQVFLVMADDFERAVICLFDDSASQTIKQSAQQYCTQLQQRNDIWKLCMERLLKPDSRQEVKFWSLQTLATFFATRLLLYSMLTFLLDLTYFNQTNYN